MRKWTIAAAAFILPVLCPVVALGAYKQKLPASASSSTAAAGGVAVSASSGSSGSTSNTSSFQALNNLSVTLTTTGRPVFVGLIPDGSTSYGAPGIVGVSAAGSLSNIGYNAYLAFFRGSTQVNIAELTMNATGVANSGGGINVPCSAIHTIDLQPAGTYTYKFEAQLNTGGSVYASYCKLVAYEL